MFLITCSKAIAKVNGCEPLTSGMAEAVEVGFSFSPEWMGLTKTAVFTSGVATVDVPESAWRYGAAVRIPHEVLALPGRHVRVGVYGTDGARVVLPTVWADLGVVLAGVDPSGDPSTDPSLPVWAQLQGQMGDLSQLETEEKSDLVSAINEAARSGSGGGESGTADDGIDALCETGYIAPATDESGALYTDERDRIYSTI